MYQQTNRAYERHVRGCLVLRKLALFWKLASSWLGVAQGRWILTNWHHEILKVTEGHSSVGELIIFSFLRRLCFPDEYDRVTGVMEVITLSSDSEEDGSDVEIIACSNFLSPTDPLPHQEVLPDAPNVKPPMVSPQPNLNNDSWKVKWSKKSKWGDCYLRYS